MNIEIDLSEGNYDGQTEDGTFSGKGTYLDCRNQIYTGTWLYGQACGYGTIEWPSGKELFAPDLAKESNELFQGTSTSTKSLFQRIKIEEGSRRKPSNLGMLGEVKRYQGRMYNNQACGEGQLEFSNGSVFKGMFKEGLPEGYGRITYLDGDYSEGSYSKGEPEGVFQYYYSAEKTLEIAPTNPLYTGTDHYVISAVKVDTPKVLTKIYGRPGHKSNPQNDIIINNLLKEIEENAQTKAKQAIQRHPAFKNKNSSSKRKTVRRTVRQ